MKTIKLKSNIKITDFLDNLRISEDYDLAYSQFKGVIDECINKNKYEDETVVTYVDFDTYNALYDGITRAFKIGYLHGYKHHKDNGNKAITDNAFKEPKTIDINKQLQYFIENGFYPKY